MQTRRITKGDFDQIVSVIDRWWGAPAGTLAHPIFFYELGQHALVAEENGSMVGFLLGFITPELPPTGYVHLVGIHPEQRRHGVGRLLYEAFTRECVSAGCAMMKAIAPMGNEGSARFHAGVGWNVEEVQDYAGPGRARLVFTRSLAKGVS